MLLGVASPSDLIKDPTRTPFNIGHRVDLTDFTPEESKPLAQGLHDDPSNSMLILDRVLFWTGGHPYLTQKLCDLIARAGNGTISEQMVDRLVEQQFLTPDAGRTEHNLTSVRDRILRDKRKGELLRLYLRIMQSKKVAADPRSLIHTALNLSGLVVVRDGEVLNIPNRIYELVFSERWGKEAMPANWPQRMAAGSLVLLLVSFGIWYEILLSRPYIEAMQAATEDYPVQLYIELRKIPGYAGKAEELLAEYWGRRAIRLASVGDRAHARFARLQGLTANDSSVGRSSNYARQRQQVVVSLGFFTTSPSEAIRSPTNRRIRIPRSASVLAA